MKVPFLAVLLVACIAIASTRSSKAALIITEVMPNPADVSDVNGEYFEVYNTGPSAIPLNGLTISDDGSNSFSITTGSATIPVGEYFVFGRTATVPGVDFDYSDFFFTLTNGADEVVISDAGGELSRLEYLDGDPFGAGTAFALNSLANAIGGTTSFSDYIAETSVLQYDGDPATDFGSPGFAGVTLPLATPEPSTILMALMIASSAGVVRLRRSLGWTKGPGLRAWMNEGP